MSENTRTKVFTVLWCVLVIAALITLGLAFVSKNFVLVIIAAIATFAVAKTHSYVPMPKVYADKGITNDLFVSRRQRAINEAKRNEESNE